jgi:hypothetical protein
MRQAVWSVLLFGMLSSLVAGGRAWAGEAGLSQYQPGFADLLAGVVPPPGTYFRGYGIYQSLRAPQVVGGGLVRVKVKARPLFEVLALTTVTKRQVFGSNYGYGILVPVGRMDIAASLETPFGELRRHRSATGLGDVMLLPLLVGGQRGREHWSATTVVYLPTGGYSVEELASLGRNRWALEEDFGYTWLDPETGGELSLLLGYTVPFSNHTTDYESGHELHLDFALAQHYRNGSVLGLVGYWLQQTTPDSGSGAMLGPFRGRTAGLGPLFSWNGSWKGQPITFTTKYYWDLKAENRVKGESLWFNFGLGL